MQKTDVENLKSKIKSGKVKDWDGVHDFYKSTSNKYQTDKLQHSISCFLTLHKAKKMDATLFAYLMNEALVTKQWITKNIAFSREKDYTNSFRKMVYDNDTEMSQVLGDIKENSFINDQKKSVKPFIKTVNDIKKKFSLK